MCKESIVLNIQICFCLFFILGSILFIISTIILFIYSKYVKIKIDNSSEEFDKLHELHLDYLDLNFEKNELANKYLFKDVKKFAKKFWEEYEKVGIKQDELLEKMDEIRSGIPDYIDFEDAWWDIFAGYVIFINAIYLIYALSLGICGNPVSRPVLPLLPLR